jgi:hypothetical protein
MTCIFVSLLCLAIGIMIGFLMMAALAASRS